MVKSICQLSTKNNPINHNIGLQKIVRAVDKKWSKSPKFVVITTLALPKYYIWAHRDIYIFRMSPVSTTARWSHRNLKFQWMINYIRVH
jgi:hypothetical protein